MRSSDSNIAAGIYVRISKDTDYTGLGVARQRADCEALAEAKGWQVAAVFEDNDVSATSGKPRPAYHRMVREIEAGRIRGIIVWDVDRLTRTPRELEDLISWADRHGLHLASVGGEIDLATPQGRLTARLKGSVARHETEQSSRRIRRKRQELAEQGRYVGPRPFGWNFTVDKGLAINDAETAVVRESVRRILAGESIRSVVYDLNNRGITTGRGSKWQAANFRAMVMRPTNAAILTHQGRELGPGAWPAIVSREDHERVLSILNDPKRRTNNRGTAEKYLLSGMIFCAECGGALNGASECIQKTSYQLADGTVQRRERTHPYRYRCQVHGCRKVTRNMKDLDEFVSKYVVGLLEREGVEILGGDSTVVEAARARVEALEAKLNLAADQWSDDQVTAEQFQRITAKLRPQLETARAELSGAMPAAEGLAKFAGPTARAAWEAASLEQRRSVIRSLLDAGLGIRVGKVGKPGGRWITNEFDDETVEIAWKAYL